MAAAVRAAARYRKSPVRFEETLVSSGLMQHVLWMTALVLVPAAVAAAPPAEHAAPVSAKSMLDVPIEDIAASQDGCAILDKDFPDLRKHAMYDFFKSMTLNQIAAMSHGRITRAMLAQAKSDLSSLPVRAAAQPLPPVDFDDADPVPGGSQVVVGNVPAK